MSFECIWLLWWIPRRQTKGKIERTVRYVRENFMVEIKYKILENLNKQAYAWSEKVNTKVHAITDENHPLILKMFSHF